jgi:hypothetical protein
MITAPNNFRDNYVVVLDSLDRDLAKYPDPANYVIALPETLRNVETIELMSFQITRTETNVNSGNNKFKIIQYHKVENQPNPSASYVYDITIPITEYETVGDFVNALQDAFDTALTNLGSPQLFPEYTNAIIDYPPNAFVSELDSTTNKIKISCSWQLQNFPGNVSFDIQVGEGAAKLLGISGTGPRGSGVIRSPPYDPINTTNPSITGRNAIDLAGIPYLILYLNDYERIIAPGSKAHKNFLVVPMENHPVGKRFIISGDQKEKKGIYILTNNQKNIYEMRVTIRRPDGTLYDFKGTDHLLIFRVFRHDFRDFNS